MIKRTYSIRKIAKGWSIDITRSERGEIAHLVGMGGIFRTKREAKEWLAHLESKEVVRQRREAIHVASVSEYCLLTPYRAQLRLVS